MWNVRRQTKPSSPWIIGTVRYQTPLLAGDRSGYLTDKEDTIDTVLRMLWVVLLYSPLHSDTVLYRPGWGDLDLQPAKSLLSGWLQLLKISGSQLTVSMCVCVCVCVWRVCVWCVWHVCVWCVWCVCVCVCVCDVYVWGVWEGMHRLNLQVEQHLLAPMIRFSSNTNIRLAVFTGLVQEGVTSSATSSSFTWVIHGITTHPTTDPKTQITEYWSNIRVKFFPTAVKLMMRSGEAGVLSPPEKRLQISRQG